MPNHFDRKIFGGTIPSRHSQAVGRLRIYELVLLGAGIATAVIHRGLRETSATHHWELGLIVVFILAAVSISIGFRYYCSLARDEFRKANQLRIAFCIVWLAGLLALVLVGPGILGRIGRDLSTAEAILAFSDLVMVISGLAGMISTTRRAAAGGQQPATILVLTFLLLIVVGTLLLLLPRARHSSLSVDEPMFDRVRVALFTATSASCVTGLTVVPTGGSEPYWSRAGQMIILCLFQLGGLGIMTCGAFFAIAVGQQFHAREGAALGEYLESNSLGDARRLLRAVLLFTVTAEIVGACLLLGLWPELPWMDRIFYGVFHSASAFCNAGFSLTDNSFVGMGTNWQVWFVLPALIIFGGLGFSVLYNLALVFWSRFRQITQPPLFGLSASRLRLTLTSRLVLWTTLVLLALGTLGYDLFESLGPNTGRTAGVRIGDAWFQSVTFRTAGFNTVDHGMLQPTTKLLAIGLMFIGAAPGSTGGGVKTIAFALTVLSLWSILRGRNRVEFAGRTIPPAQVHRALAIISLGIGTLMATTLLLVLFENRPDAFLDHLFEATSACATVGVSTGITPELSTPSQMVLVLAMFLGRVGPLTLMLAMSRWSDSAFYQFPEERVILG